jgi:hypothetical protein
MSGSNGLKILSCGTSAAYKRAPGVHRISISDYSIVKVDRNRRV